MQRRDFTHRFTQWAGWLALGGTGALGACTALQRVPVAAVPVPGPPSVPGPAQGTLDTPPPLPRELRGAWVATVANIDWPSRRDLPTALQRLEMLSALDAAQAIGLNALLLQVRPSADTLYPSPLEPWSEYLTGVMGQPPAPFWDPLAEWVTEAHRRGLELHAWLNPYRARSHRASSPQAAGHLSQRRPDLVRAYGDQLWIDPAEPDAAAHTQAVVRDLLQRYDLDGLHIDDYFYPYPAKGDGGAEIDFPDAAPWQRYRDGGGTLARADWRRGHVDRLVQALHRLTQQVRPGTRFSISPFGLGKPALRPPGITGFSQYDKLYADVERWVAEGWLDALVPQLYWPIAQRGQAFGTLLDYWLAQNPRGRHVWPGLYTSRLPAPGEPAAETPWPAQEIVDQIALTRARGVAGHVHFSLVALQQDRDGIATRLRRQVYATPAVPPATPWLDARAPAAPTARIVAGAEGAPGPRLDIAPGLGGALPRRYAVWWRLPGANGTSGGPAWRLAVQPATAGALRLPADAVPDRAVVSALSRTGVEGPRAAFDLRPA